MLIEPCGLIVLLIIVAGQTVVSAGLSVFFCLFGVLGSTIQLGAVLDFSDAMVFLIALPNIFGLYLLAPVLKEELKNYKIKLRKIES